MNTHVPFLDINTPHEVLRDELLEVFKSAVKTGQFVGGPVVEGFESEFAKFCDAKYCIGVGSGTDALRFALMGAGVAPGDLVLTVPNTFIATTEAITQVGAIPAFIDIDSKTYNMNVEKLNEYLENECYVDGKSGKTVHRSKDKTVSAVIPVHLYGQMADMDTIMDLSERFNLLVIEDACQAHGAEYFSKRENRWLKAGSVGNAAAFSFYPGKNLGALGEGGAVTTDDEDIAYKVKIIRDHGQSEKYHHEVEGYNGRLDAIQAGILKIKLKHLPEWNAKRRMHSDRYNELFGDCDEIITPFVPEWAKSVFHLYVIRTKDRVALQKHLADAEIYTGLHYPVPLHLQRAYTNLGYSEGSLSVSERISKEILSLPMFPDMTDSQLRHVTDKTKEYVCS